jgi:hypothetical protein
MLPRQTDRKLESFKIFPYVAWGLVVFFVFFVYKLSTELDDNASTLDKKANSLEEKVKTDSKDLRNINFEE